MVKDHSKITRVQMNHWSEFYESMIADGWEAIYRPEFDVVNKEIYQLWYKNDPRVEDNPWEEAEPEYTREEEYDMPW